MSVTCVAGRGDNAPRRAGRLHVTVIGAPLLPSAVAAIAGRLAERGANIDRIRRLSRWPVTTVEFDVSGDDVLVLRRELAAEAVAHRRRRRGRPPPGWPGGAGASSSWTSTRR